MLAAFIEAMPDIAQSSDWVAYVNTVSNIIGNSSNVITSVFIVIITLVIGHASYKTNKREERERIHKIRMERTEKLLSLSNYLIQNRDLFESIRYPIFKPGIAHKCVVYFDFDPSHNDCPNEFTRYGFAMVQNIENPNNLLSFEYMVNSQVESVSIEIVSEPKIDLKSDTWDRLFEALKGTLNYTVKNELSFSPVRLVDKDVDEISHETRFVGKRRGHASMNTKADRKIVDAILNINVEKVKNNIDKASHIDARDSSGRTFLHYAVSIAYDRLGNDYDEVLTGNPEDIDGSKYISKLVKNLDEIISILINKDANINALDNIGESAMHAAAESGNYRAVDILQTKGASVDMPSDYSGNTALHVAAHTGWKIIVEKLINNGYSLNLKNFKGETPLHYACQSNEFGILDKSAQSAIVEMLIEKGARFCEKDDKGEAPLHKASDSGSPTTIEILIKKGAEVNDVDSNGETPLHKASYSGSLPAIEILMENGARIDGVNLKGETPLHIALRNPDSVAAMQMASFFIEKGASISCKDKNGKSPHDLILKLIFRRRGFSRKA